MTATSFASFMADPFRIALEAAAERFRGLQTTRRRRLARRTLCEMDDHLLKDIGLCRAEIMSVVNDRSGDRRHANVLD
jgi:uncharacterized protein YjiS (DUF1127 family)